MAQRTPDIKWHGVPLEIQQSGVYRPWVFPAVSHAVCL